MGKNELPDQIRVTFQLERGEYIRGVRYYLRKSHLVSWVQVLVMLFALAATVTVTLMMGRLNFLNTLVLVLLAMAALYSLWLYWIKPGRIFDREAELAEPVTFLFAQEDVARQDETVAALLDWDIKKLWRGPEFYYLFGSSEGYTLLPLRAFQDEEARLRFESLAQEANPDMIFRHFGLQSVRHVLKCRHVQREDEEQ